MRGREEERRGEWRGEASGFGSVSRVKEGAASIQREGRERGGDGQRGEIRARLRVAMEVSAFKKGERRKQSGESGGQAKQGQDSEEG